MRDEVLAEGFVERFPDSDYAGRTAVIDDAHIVQLLGEFRRLRLTDETVYLRNGAVNLINGMINMSFSCDGTQYLDHRAFFDALEKFG